MATEAKIVISATNTASNVFAQVKREFADVNNSATLLKGALASLTAGLSVGAMAAFARNIVNGLDALNDMADATGATVENLSALEDVAARNGTSLDTVTSSMVRFNKVLTEAQDPGSQAANILKAIGLNAKELRDIDPAEALHRTAVALAGYADDGNKARVVQELFGKNVKEIAPFLKDLAEQGALNAKVTTEQAKAAEAFNKEISALNKNFTDLGRYLYGDFITAVNAAAKAMRESGFLAGLQVLMGGDAQHQQNVRFSQLTAQKLEIEQQLGAHRKELPAGVSTNPIIQRYEAALAMVDAQLAPILKARQGGNGTDATAYGPYGYGGRIDKPTLGDVAGPDKKGGPPKGKSARELKLEFDMMNGRAYATEQGERVNAENAAFQAERARQAEAEIQARRDAIADEGEAINAANTAYQAYKSNLLDSGPAAQLEKQRQEMQFLADLFTSGEITSEQYLDAVTGRLGLVNTELEKTNDIGKELGLTFTSAFEDAIVGGKKFGDVLQGLAQDVGRIVLRKTVTEPLGNWITSILPSFDVGTPYVPRDMVAQIHQGERIIPASQNKPGAMGGITYAPVINIDARADAGQVQATVSQALARNNEQFVSMLQRQGVLA